MQVAIAWSLTRDDEFCNEIACYENAEKNTFCACNRLEQEMMKAGCFEAVNETIPLDPPSRTIVMIRQKLNSSYVGRFGTLAEDYVSGGNVTYTSTIKALPHSVESAAGIVSVLDFLLGRWHDAFRSIADRIADGDVRARGVAIDGEKRLPNGDMPAASASNAMWMDLEGVVWEGPQPAWGDKPRRWIDITVKWDDLMKCFEPIPMATPSGQSAAAETRCRDWLTIEMKASLDQTTTAKKEWYQVACGKFPGLGNAENETPSRSFDRAWNASISATGAKWNSSGRKKSKH